MSGADAFFDTNVVLYLLSANSKKADRDETLIGGGGMISVQVLNEFASVASRKLGMSLAEIRELLDVVRAVCDVKSISEATHDCALGVYERYGFSIYDSMMVASALLANCSVLYSEDLQDGQRIEERLTIRNPFKSG